MVICTCIEMLFLSRFIVNKIANLKLDLIAREYGVHLYFSHYPVKTKSGDKQ